MYPRAPFVRLILPFVLGIIAAGIWPFPWKIAGAASIGLLLSLLSFHFFRTQHEKFIHRQHFGFLVNGALFSLGLFISSFESQFVPENHVSRYCDSTQEVILILDEKPIEKKKSYKAFAEVEGILDSSSILEISGGVVIYFQKSKSLLELEAGQKLVCRAKLQSPPSVLNPKEFDYKTYLQRKGIFLQTYLDSNSWQVFDMGICGRWTHRFVRWRDDMLEELRPYVEKGDVFEVLSALILGKTSELDRELMAHYSGAGAIHVLAVSGLHVGLIYLFLLQLFSFVFREKFRLIRVIVIAAVLWIYAAISGFSPSVLRSTVMFTFILIGTGILRNSDIFNSLSSSAFILLGYEPSMLYDIGFQLSYLAVLGIVLFQKGLESLWYVKTGILYKIWQLTCVSLAAQIITFPIGLYYFGQFPNYFLFANLIVIPLSTGILYVAILFFALSWISWLAKPLGYILSLGTQWLNTIVSYTDQLPGSKTENISLSLFWTIFLIFISGWFMLIWQNRNWMQLKPWVFTVSFAFLFSTFEQIQRSHQEPYLCVHSLKEGIGATFIAGDSIYYFYKGDSVLTKEILERKMKTFWRSLNRGEAEAINMEDHSIKKGTHYYKSEQGIILGNAFLNFNPKQVVENSNMPELVFMDNKDFMYDIDRMKYLLSKCNYLLIGADVKRYKWEKLQTELSHDESKKTFYLGYGAVFYDGIKISQ